jgi:hypothetical protein
VTNRVVICCAGGAATGLVTAVAGFGGWASFACSVVGLGLTNAWLDRRDDAETKRDATV